jgi:tetratricopeptide (TPR) repeat protein
MNNRDFHYQYSNAVALHRQGQTEQALAAIESLLVSAANDEQRTACINEKIHLLFHLGRRDEVLKLGADLASLLPQSPKLKALSRFLEQGQKAQAAVDAILASRKS